MRAGPGQSSCAGLQGWRARTGAWGLAAGLLLGLPVGLAPSLAAAQAAPGDAATRPAPVTLEEALTRAQQYAPQGVQAAGNARTAQAAERAALGAYLPSLSGTARSALASSNRFNPQTNTPVTGSSTTYSAGLSAGWDVFTGFRRGAERTRTHAQTEAAESSLVQQRADIALAVVQAFYEEQRAEELVTVARAQLERAQQGVAAAERRSGVGNATRSDVLRAQLELNTARASLRQAETQHLTARYALGRLVGLDGAADAQLTGPVSPTPLSLSGASVSDASVSGASVSDAALVDTLVREAPAVQAAEASARAASAGVGVARAQYFPTVRLSAGYDWYTQELSPSAGRGAWNVGLGLSLPLFDGFARDEGMVRAQTQQAVAAAQLEDTRRQLRSEATRALAQVRLEEDRIGFAEQAVAVAQEDLRVQQERYRLGVTTMLDLLTSQGNLVQAERALVTARFDYQLARAGLESLAGRHL